MKAHLCPRCNGERVVIDGSIVDKLTPTRVCPTCKGEGVLWSYERITASGAHVAGDKLEKKS
jgi:DnaJ-class molecular chaperone